MPHSQNGWTGCAMPEPKPMPDYVDEDQFPLCSDWWRSERPAFRANLEWIPLGEPICIPCLMAWSRNIGFPVRDDEPTLH